MTLIIYDLAESGTPNGPIGQHKLQSEPVVVGQYGHGQGPVRESEWVVDAAGP